MIRIDTPSEIIFIDTYKSNETDDALVNDLVNLCQFKKAEVTRFPQGHLHVTEKTGKILAWIAGIGLIAIIGLVEYILIQGLVKGF